MEKVIAAAMELERGLSIILTNRIFWTCFTAWFLASFIKVILFFIQHRRFDFRLLIDTGRMPSSHSAFTACLATVVGMEAGWSSPVFMVALGVAILTMNDAAGVRRAAGRQAAVLNRILDDMNQKKTIPGERLKEFLGHTRLEVLAGMSIGIIWGLLIY